MLGWVLCTGASKLQNLVPRRGIGRLWGLLVGSEAEGLDKLYCAAHLVVFIIGSIWVPGFLFRSPFWVDFCFLGCHFFFLISKEMFFGFLLNYFELLYGYWVVEFWTQSCPGYHKTAPRNVFLLILRNGEMKKKEINYSFFLFLGLGTGTWWI